MKTKSLHNQLVEWRQDFHMHPELGFEESRTSESVAKLLNEFGLEVHKGIAKTGVIGVLKKGSGDKSIGIRADMDALPIHEANTFNYISRNKGKMHACGHDGHTTMVLGAAKYLAENGNFNGTAYFIFQPDEENTFGAKTMIDEGLFTKFSIDEVYAMHNMPNMKIGTFATRQGTITASENLFEITIEGKGGHAALPHMGVDAIMVGSQIVSALQTIISRKVNPISNGVVSVTEFTSDGRKNVLPGKVVLSGDARALSKETNEIIEKNMLQIVNGICESHGISSKVTYSTTCPVTFNSAEPTQAAIKAADGLVGNENINGDCEPKLFSEDFSLMSSSKPGCFILMGNGTSGSNAQPLHSPYYDFNDEALVIGSSYWSDLVEQQLS